MLISPFLSGLVDVVVVPPEGAARAARAMTPVAVVLVPLFMLAFSPLVVSGVGGAEKDGEAAWQPGSAQVS